MRSEFQEQFSGEPVPLVPGALRGYRQWTLTIGMGLKSIAQDWVWPEELTASCVLGRKHEAPAGDCSCGIYACHQPTDDQVRGSSVLAPFQTVMGVIEAWGRVELGRRGFRAQHARVRALAVERPNPYLKWVPADWIRTDLRVTLDDGRTIPAKDIPEHWTYLDWQVMIRRNYPGVTLFRDRAAMLKAFPPVDVGGLAPAPVQLAE